MVDFSQLTTGHWLLTLCCVLYLAWWAVYFWPQPYGRGVENPTLRKVGVACIIGALIAGCLSAWQLLSGSSVDNPAVSPWLIAGIAVVLYLVLLWITYRMFNRQPTTELVLFVAWAALEFDVLSSIAGTSANGASAIGVGIYSVLVIASFVVALICYIRYYHLKSRQSFIDGCIPLVLIGIVEAVLPAITQLI
ncbi:MAG: hypothetical protein ACOYIK_05115 [Coriobacteriales bacterium]|jgi:FtsH-binding integral membrane protein